jgi:hypothetical protein
VAAEFQWPTPEESSSLAPEQLEAVRLEIADVAIYLIRRADVLGMDVAAAVRGKLATNGSRFAEARPARSHHLPTEGFGPARFGHNQESAEPLDLHRCCGGRFVSWMPWSGGALGMQAGTAAWSGW